MWACACSSAWSFSDAYDTEFRRAAERYMPVATAAWGWQVLKAQCYQESLLKADAVSPVGAKGLCQFMPATWQEAIAGLNLPRDASAFMPEYSIRAAAWYMQRQRAVWKAPRPEWDRHTLALASYNAGAGNLIKAQRVAGGVAGARPILDALPQVTGHHAQETQTYVDRIWQFWLRMRLH